MPQEHPEDLTHERLLTLLDYDPHQGLLTWRRNRGRSARAGDEAGTTSKSNVVMVGVDGRMYTAARLCWFHAHGEWPTQRLRFKDGNSLNLRLANIVPEDQIGVSWTTAGAYQRQWRRDRREADRRIAEDPLLLARWNAIPLGDKDRERRFVSRVMEDVRDDRLRNQGRGQ